MNEMPNIIELLDMHAPVAGKISLSDFAMVDHDNFCATMKQSDLTRY